MSRAHSLIVRILVLTGVAALWATAAYLAHDAVGRSDSAAEDTESPGVVRVSTEPEGASVIAYCGGASGVLCRGVTPCDLDVSGIPSADQADPREVLLDIAKPGFVSVRRTVRVGDGDTPTVQVALVAAQTASGKPPAPRGGAQPVTIAAVGDIRLGEVADPFGAVADRLRSPDVTFGNLECVLTNATAHTGAKSDTDIANQQEFVFRAHPKWANALALAGFDVVSLANNHAMDYGAAGLRDTMAALDKTKVRYAGAGTDLAAARSRREVTVGGVRVGFLAVCTLAPPEYAAASDRPGIAAHPIGSAQPWLIDAVRAARKNVDLLCVSLHWGVERQTVPDQSQRDLALACVHAGASFVMGHHPHCLQPVEVVDGALVAYSLGNFVGLGTNDLSLRSMILTARFVDGRLEWYEETPIRLANLRPVPDGPTRRIAAGGPVSRPMDTESRS